MEIREIISHYANINTSNLEVDFRLIEDTDDVLRTDTITFKEINDFGFDFINQLDDLNHSFNSEDEDDYDDDFMFGFDESIDLDEIKSFLDEYYMVYPDRLPKPEVI